MAVWTVSARKADFDRIAEQFHISPITARLLRNRDIITDEQIHSFLHGTLADLHDPMLLKDMDLAVAGICEALKREEHIRIIGDYDIDGVSSTYILKQGLTEYAMERLLKSEDEIHVDTVLPDRIKDGYGMNDSMIEEAATDGVNLILTCDNGIAAASQIALAVERGMKVIVTDHHEVPYSLESGERKEILPNAAFAIVDPKRSDCRYPFKNICGGVVAWKLIQAMFGDLRQQYLPFAALATVGDVMELLDENRIIVKEGLKAFAHCTNAGLNALMLACKLNKNSITAYQIGYVLGPCINATGRIDTAERALELFLEQDPVPAGAIAGELTALNTERKNMTRRYTQDAIGILSKRSPLPKVIAIYLEGCHESLAGIIAGRLRERFNRPAYVMTGSVEGIKGSGRSIPEYHMYEHLHAVEDLLLKYGGHSQAAGFSLKEENLSEFIRRLEEGSSLTDSDIEEKVHIDMAMPLQYATMNLVNEIKTLEPFGTGNPSPVFAQKDIVFCGAKRLGSDGRVIKFSIRDEWGRSFALIHFKDPDAFDDYITQNLGKSALEALYAGNGDIKLKVTYYPDLNEYNGRVSLQYVMLNYML